MRRTNTIRPAPNNNCGPRNPCGMKGGLFNPFFQNGVDIAGITGMGSSGVSSPIQILGSKLVFWFDNNDSTKVVTSGGNVVSQTDQTGNYTRTVASPAANPTYVTSWVTTDSKSILYKGAEGLKLSVNGLNHSQGELFIVFRRYGDASVGLTNNNTLMGATQTSVANRFVLFQDFANTSSIGNSLGFQIQAGATNNQAFATTKSLSDKKIIANFRSSGTAYNMGFDRDLDRGKTFNTGSDNGDWLGDIFSVSDLISFGYRVISSGNSFSTHYEYEVIYSNTVLTTTERSQIMTYLNNKHDCYRDVSYNLGVVFTGTSNTQGQALTANAPNRLKVALPKGYIRTGTNTFANLLCPTNNEGNNYGPEMSFIAALSEYFNQDIYLAKQGFGGSRYCIITGANPVVGGTTTWNVAAADLYPGLQTEATELQTKMTSLGSNKIIFFHIGGENEAFYQADANGLQVNLDAVITGVEGLAPSTYFYIINKIRTDLVGTGGAPTRQAGAITTIQTAQQAIVTAKGATKAVLLDMVNYSSAGDTVHFVGFQPVLIGRDAFDFIKVLVI